MPNDFYIHLESSLDPKGIFKNNNPATFSVFLPDTIKLENKNNYQWQVALEQISIPNSFYNISGNEVSITYEIRKKLENPIVNIGPPLSVDKFQELQEIDQNAQTTIALGNTQNLPLLHSYWTIYLERRERPDELDIVIILDLRIPNGFYDPISYVNVINQRALKLKEFVVNRYPSLFTMDELQFEMRYNNNNKKFYISLNTQRYEETISENNLNLDMQTKIDKLLNLLKPVITRVARRREINNKNQEIEHVSESEERKRVYNLYSILESVTINNDRLRDMYGCASNPATIEVSQYLPHLCNMNKYFQRLFIYSNIVQNSIINTIYAPILRIIDLSNEINTTFTSLDTKSNSKSKQKFRITKNILEPHLERLQYYNVSKNIINHISISLYNEYGEILNFQPNSRIETSLTLHFKQNRLY